jgi:hypothetical protein
VRDQSVGVCGIECLMQEPEDERGWVGKIADFGLSVKIKRGEQHVSGIQHGTEGYVAPGAFFCSLVTPGDTHACGVVAHAGPRTNLGCCMQRLANRCHVLGIVYST